MDTDFINAVEAEKCKRSLLYFIQSFWHAIESRQAVWNWHIPYIADKLQEHAIRVGNNLPLESDLVINIPPSSTKSLLCTIFFPVWCWLNWPWMRFMCLSYNGALSLSHAYKSREIIRSQLFKELFPGLQIKADKDNKSNFLLTYVDDEGRIRNGGNRFSTSVGGTATGEHADIIILDDPSNPGKSSSAAELLATNNWIDHTMHTRKVDQDVTLTIIVMQRLHQNDTTANFIQNSNNVCHICLPGELEGYEKFVSPPELKKKYSNGLFDPKRLNRKALDNLYKKLGQYGYAGQIGQNPVPATGGMFRVDHFQIMSSLDSSMIKRVIRYWDKACTKGGRGAYTVGVKMALLKNNSLVVMDVKRGRWSTDERECIIKETAEVDGVSVKIGIEREPGSGGKESAEATIKNLIGFSVFDDSPTGDKTDRADPYSVQVNVGNVVLLSGPWNTEYIDEFRFFPLSTYKDQVDASSGAFAYLIKSKKKVKLLN